MKNSIDNFLLDGWNPTPVERALMNDDFDKLLNDTDIDDTEDIPSDFIEVQDFNSVMEEIKNSMTKVGK